MKRWVKRKKRWLKSNWQIFRYHIRQRSWRKAAVVAVTGSCGKTSTTHFLGKILSDTDASRIGISNNCRIAVTETLRGVTSRHRFILQELGVDAPGFLDGVLPLLRPQVGILTCIGQDHYRKFRTLEATAAEKRKLIAALPRGGVAVLNADDPLVLGTTPPRSARVLTYGLSDQADVRGHDIRSTWPERLSLTVSHAEESVRIETGLFGDILVGSVLAAVAGALAVGISLKQCADSLKGIHSFSRRMAIHVTSRGAWYICDTAKAPFWSVGKVLAQLEHVRAPRKTVVFGSFSDTAGSASPKYRAMARQALEVADRVVFVGPKAVYVRNMITTETKGRLFAMASLESAAQLLGADVLCDEVVLIKSSKLEHAERLFWAQDTNLGCWKPSCALNESCECCPESGLPLRTIC